MAYGYGLPALNGQKLWPIAEGYPVIPPPVRSMPGRPKKVRRRDPFENDPARPDRLRKICDDLSELFPRRPQHPNLQE